MDDYISRSAFIEAKEKQYCQNCDRRKNSKGQVVYEIGDAPCRACGIGYMLDDVEDFPAADVRPVVYCRDCIHRPYSTEPGKTSGFAVEAPDRECKCPCFNPDDGYYSWIPADDFFCADGERREGGTDA